MCFFQMAILIHFIIFFCDMFREVTRDLWFQQSSRWDYTCTLKRNPACIVPGQCKWFSWSIVALAVFVSYWTWMPHFHISSLLCHPPLHGPPGAVMCFFQMAILIHFIIFFCDMFREVTRDLWFQQSSRWDYTCTLKRNPACIVPGQCKWFSWSINI